MNVEKKNVIAVEKAVAAIKQDTPLQSILPLAPACSCDACTVGCRHGSGFCVAEDIPSLASFLNISQEQLKENYLEEVRMWNTLLWRPRFPKPFGNCIFFKEGKCSVHEVKPLHCKVSSGCSKHGSDLHAWFLQNHALQKEDKLSMLEFEAYKQAGGKVLD